MKRTTEENHKMLKNVNAMHLEYAGLICLVIIWVIVDFSLNMLNEGDCCFGDRFYHPDTSVCSSSSEKRYCTTMEPELISNMQG